MRLPSVFLLGAARSGTTALYHLLARHPEIHMSPVKEPQFFACLGAPSRFTGPGDEAYNAAVVTDLGAYGALFAGARGRRAVGEASTWYLSSPEAPERIRRHVPDAALLAVLRDPAERAWSAYLRMVRDGLEPAGSFEDALAREPERVAAGWAPPWHYARRGFYGEQVRRYLDVFGRDRLRVYLHEDFLADPRALLRDVFAFLGVDPAFVAEVPRGVNAGGVPRSPALQRVVSGSHPLRRLLLRVLPSPLRLHLGAPATRLNVSRPALPPAIRARLVAGYREDVRALQDLLERDLSRWLR